MVLPAGPQRVVEPFSGDLLRLAPFAGEEERLGEVAEHEPAEALHRPHALAERDAVSRHLDRSGDVTDVQQHRAEVDVRACELERIARCRESSPRGGL